MMKQSNGGFTLIELIISIAIGTLITAAALSTLLMGMRINGETASNVKQQNTTSMLMQVVQNVVEESDITVPDNSTIANADGTIHFVSYSDGIVYLNGNAFMEDVEDFEAVLSEDNQQLTVTVTVDGKDYTATAYCRLNPTPSPEPEPDPAPEGGDGTV